MLGDVRRGWTPVVGVTVFVESIPGLRAGFVTADQQVVLAARASCDLFGERPPLLQVEAVSVHQRPQPLSVDLHVAPDTNGRNAVAAYPRSQSRDEGPTLSQSMNTQR